jgi:hypothetical protein
MTVLGKSILAATVGVAVLASSSLPASAYIACRDHVCWHVTERHEYPGSARVVIRDDDWKWKRHEHYVWREHEGRGYWHGSRWETW